LIFFNSGNFEKSFAKIAQEIKAGISVLPIKGKSQRAAHKLIGMGFEKVLMTSEEDYYVLEMIYHFYREC